MTTKTKTVTLPSVDNIRPNLTRVEVNGTNLWFSYRTLIAFANPSVGLVVSENCWSTTTGKHLNTIDGGNKVNRLKRAEFEAKYAELVS